MTQVQPTNTNAFIQAIQAASRDNVINAVEVQAILQQAEADGVISDGEKQALRALLFNNSAHMTEQARENLQRWLNQFSSAGDTQVMNVSTAVATLQQNFAQIAGACGNSGTISRSDLTAIINDPNSSPQLVAAARWLQNNFSTYANVSGSGGSGSSSLINLRDLQVGASYSQMTAQSAYQTLLQNWARLAGPNGVTRASLQGVLDNPNAPNDLKAAAAFLLNNPSLFNRADVAYNGYISRSISEIDIRVAISRENMSDRQAAVTLMEQWAGLRAGREMTHSELMHFIHRVPSSPELAAAADILQANPTLWTQITGSPPPFGTVTPARLEAWLLQSNVSASVPSMNPAMLAPTTIAPTNGAGGVNGAPGAGPGPGPGQAAGGHNQSQIQNPNISNGRSLNVLDREIDSVLTDPTLTVEDKVAYVLMLISKYMDRQIEQQLDYIKNIQLSQNQAQAGRGQNAAAQPGQPQAQPPAQGQPPAQAQPQPAQPAQPGAPAQPQAAQGGPNNFGDTSIDVEVTKLKRMIDKRGQMFDMLRQVIDKYNQTAKGMIDSIGR